MKMSCDSYAWLENLTDENVVKWALSHNEKTRKLLSPVSKKFKEILKSKLGKVFLKSARITDRGIYALYVKQDKYYVKLLKKDLSRPIFILSSGKRSIVAKKLYASPRGDVFALTFSLGGLDYGGAYLIEADTGKIIDEIKGVVYNFVWLGDQKLYYVRSYRKTKPPDGGSVPAPRICVWESGKEEVIWGSGLSSPHRITIKASSGRDKALITVYNGWLSSAVYVGELKDPGTWRKLYAGENFLVKPIDFLNNQYYLVAYDGKGFGRIIGISNANTKKVKTVLRERSSVLVDAEIIKNTILTSYLMNAASRLKMYSLQGCKMGEIRFETPGTVTIYDSTVSGVLFKYENFLTPYKLFYFDLDEMQLLDSRSENINHVVRDAWATSKDGTRIHMFVVKKRGAKISKVLLYGYGGFNKSMTPKYNVLASILLNRGWTYVLTNLRGGGERGRKWHLDGAGRNKHKVFEDFIACAEYFKKRGAKIAAYGVSNGGLLVAAILTQKPSLFDAAVIGYPVIDMLRFHKLYIGRLWITEYGNPEKEDDRKYLLSYSPYHNIKNADYPPILVFTGLNDDRVHPAHAFKFVAKLEEVGAKPLLRVEKASGHSGASFKIRVEEMADVLAFLETALSNRK